MTHDISFPPHGSDPCYFYAATSNEPVGPLALSKLRHLHSVGVISDETLVIEDGGAEWRSYASIAGASDAVVSSPSLPAASQPPPLPTAAPKKAPSRSPLVVALVCVCLALVAVICGLVVFIGATRSTSARQANDSRENPTPPPPPETPVVSARKIVAETSNEQMRPTPRAQSKSSLVAKTTPAPAKKTTPAPKRLAQFEKFRLGDFTYEIKGGETRRRLGSTFSYTDAGAGAVFLVVRYTIHNESNKTETVMSDDFTLRDAQGRDFRPAARAITALMMEGKNQDFLVRELQPGITKDAMTVFEVPDAALAGALVLVVPEKGFLGTGKIEVAITPDAANATTATPPTPTSATPLPTTSRRDDKATPAPLPMSQSGNITTADGEVFKNATITKNDAIGVVIAHDDGVTRVAYDRLPEELRKQFNYDPQQARTQATAERRAAMLGAQASEAATQAERERLRKLDTERDASVRDSAATRTIGASGITFRLHIIQNTGSIALATYQLGNVIVGRGPTFIEYSETADEPIAVAGLSTLVDGDSWEGVLYPAGNFSYTTVAGTPKSVRLFAPSPQQALQLLKR